jgi:hypothetical protein
MLLGQPCEVSMQRFDYLRLLRSVTAILALGSVLPASALAADPTPDPAEPPFIGTVAAGQR